MEHKKDEEFGLDPVELDRLQELAEHPELADPLLAFLPDRKERGGTR